jgi:hypothetical protein
VSITISADDPRTIRAIEIAAEADYWLNGRDRSGRDVFGIPSQNEPGRYYIVSAGECDCPDFLLRHEPCKHVLAVQLHQELARAQYAGQRADRRRGHLSVVAN